jgi:hypothetical protein
MSDAPQSAFDSHAAASPSGMSGHGFESDDSASVNANEDEILVTDEFTVTEVGTVRHVNERTVNPRFLS